MKKVWISLICLGLAAIACVSIFLYRRSLFNLQISIARTEIPVGWNQDLGINAMATGRYVEKAVELTPKVTGTYDANKVGTYHITVTAAYKGKTVSGDYDIVVYDDVPPQISLQTKEGYFTLPGAEYEEEG